MSAHVDTFARDRMPSAFALPVVTPIANLPAQLNAANWLFSNAMQNGNGERTMLRDSQRRVTYAQADCMTNQLARFFIERWQLVPGNRVLLRGGNSIDLALAWLACVKAGVIAVATMPLLRAKELGEIVQKAQITHALCADALWGELEKTQRENAVVRVCERFAQVFVPTAQMSEADAHVQTDALDIAMFAFTSGTTGKPKAAMHTHRDLIEACHAWPAHVLHANANDVIVGSPPLAFTFGLGGLLLFPMFAGACVVFPDRAYTPETMVDTINDYGATTTYTAPTFYRQMAAFAKLKGVRSLRKSVSAGEALPDSTRGLWREATGIEMIDGIGATEMFHIFISSAEHEVKAGAIGKVVPGYEARIVDAQGNELPRGTVGALAVRGCTGCKYLDDARQANYVQHGWNFPGDAFLQDEEGYFFYQARADDMIISSGYNIGAPEVEDALLTHAAVAECAVIGKPDEERGMIVKAFIVLKKDHAPEPDTVRALQDHVKATIAPYKYPREIEFVQALPRTETGKLQRFKLRVGA
jgi:2-aminobenzoate-CoA ligase